MILELLEVEATGKEVMNRANMESIRCFLVYMARTYRYMNPYLIFFYLTLDSWRPLRDKEGWCMQGGKPKLA